jgi:ABC-type Na+ efflux pump permease subunit
VINMDTFTIMLKDLRLLSRDRRALVILVAMPMVIIAIVGSSTGRLRANREKSRQGLTIEVADFDQSETAIRLAGFLAGYENVILRMIDLGNGKNTTMLKELESERPTGDVDMRLVIQPGFEEKLAEMSTTQLLSGDKSVREKGLQSINLILTSNESAADPMMEGPLENHCWPCHCEAPFFLCWCVRTKCRCFAELLGILSFRNHG